MTTPRGSGSGTGGGSAADGATAIILARAGTKGLPGKNAALVGGRPCVRWTIDAAERSRRVSRVVVSTDCPAVRDVAERAGVTVIARPADLASDSASVDDAARHAAEAARVGDHTPIVILYANVPVRPDDLIDRALEVLTTAPCDSVQSYAGVGKHHPWWTVRVDEASGRVSPWEGEVLYHGVYRRQMLPAAHIPDGGVIALTRRALFREIPGVAPGPHAFLGLDRRGVITGEGDVIDIDSRVDQIVADAVLRGRARAAGVPAPGAA